MTASERFAAIDFLRHAKSRIIARAASVGSQHSGWDVLSSIEHYTDGTVAYTFTGDEGLQSLVDVVTRSYPELEAMA